MLGTCDELGDLANKKKGWEMYQEKLASIEEQEFKQNNQGRTVDAIDLQNLTPETANSWNESMNSNHKTSKNWR